MCRTDSVNNKLSKIHQGKLLSQLLSSILTRQKYHNLFPHPLILIGNVNNLKIDDVNIPKISKEKASELALYRLRQGDIVFSRVGSLGRVALVGKKEEGWLISGQMLRLRIENPKLDHHFAAYAFGDNKILEFVKLQSVGSTRESINTEILRNIPLPVPPVSEQQAIVDFLDAETARLDAITTRIETQLEKIKEYRQALISAAVTGKIDVREYAHAPQMETFAMAGGGQA